MKFIGIIELAQVLGVSWVFEDFHAFGVHGIVITEPPQYLMFTIE